MHCPNVDYVLGVDDSAGVTTSLLKIGVVRRAINRSDKDQRRLRARASKQREPDKIIQKEAMIHALQIESRNGDQLARR